MAEKRTCFVCRRGPSWDDRSVSYYIDARVSTPYKPRRSRADVRRDLHDARMVSLKLSGANRRRRKQEARRRPLDAKPSSSMRETAPTGR